MMVSPAILLTLKMLLDLQVKILFMYFFSSGKGDGKNSKTASMVRAFVMFVYIV